LPRRNAVSGRDDVVDRDRHVGEREQRDPLPPPVGRHDPLAARRRLAVDLDEGTGCRDEGKVRTRCRVLGRSKRLPDEHATAAGERGAHAPDEHIDAVGVGALRRSGRQEPTSHQLEVLAVKAPAAARTSTSSRFNGRRRPVMYADVSSSSISGRYLAASAARKCDRAA
jgi:hypothetical protein